MMDTAVPCGHKAPHRGEGGLAPQSVDHHNGGHGSNVTAEEGRTEDEESGL